MSENLPQVMQQPDSMFFNVALFEHAQRVARVFAKSSLIPESLRGKDENQAVANIMLAMNLANRMKLDPYMVMQSMYIVHGRPGIEAKLAIAAVNVSGRFTPIQYDMAGEGDARYCIAYAKDTKTGEVCKGPKVTIEMAKGEGWHGKPGSKWKTMPDLMLQYRAAMFFARTFAPETILGMHSREEIRDMSAIDFEMDSNGSYAMPNATPEAPAPPENIRKPEPPHAKAEAAPVQEKPNPATSPLPADHPLNPDVMAQVGPASLPEYVHANYGAYMALGVEAQAEVRRALEFITNGKPFPVYIACPESDAWIAKAACSGCLKMECPMNPAKPKAKEKGK